MLWFWAANLPDGNAPTPAAGLARAALSRPGREWRRSSPDSSSSSSDYHPAVPGEQETSSEIWNVMARTCCNPSMPPAPEFRSRSTEAILEA